MKYKIYFIALIAVVLAFSECKKKKEEEPDIQNIFPTVSITLPVNNATFTDPASITINATAGDVNGTVTKVDFFNGTTLLGTDASSPYSFTWTNVTAGSYALTAKATDNSGAITISSVINVVVNPIYTDVCTGNAANTKYVPLTVGNTWNYEGDAFSVTSTISKDTIAGGNTYYVAVIIPTNPILPTSYQRYKTNGELVGLNPDSLAAGKLHEETIIPANPTLNYTWTDSKGANYTITSPSTSKTTLAPCTYSGLLAITVVTSSSTIIYYYKQGVGLVYLECSSGIACNYFTYEYVKTMQIQ